MTDPTAFFQQLPWPLPYRPSLSALEDEGLRREATWALLLVAVLASAMAAALWRRRPGFALAACLGMLWVGVSRLDVLVVPAYPTSFHRSPTRFGAASIVEGARLYGPHCASCHGVTGKGDGRAAAGLEVPPADLTAAHLLDHDDGELFWWLSHGIDGPDGTRRMPGFGDQISDRAIWNLIDYVRANNAGVAVRQSGTWTRPAQAPPISATCADGRQLGAAALKGRVLRLIVADGHAAPAVIPAPEIVQDILVANDGSALLAGCRADDPDLLGALAILTGDDVADLRGSQILIDPLGHLRARSRAGDARGATTVDLFALVDFICRVPATDADATGHEHH